MHPERRVNPKPSSQPHVQIWTTNLVPAPPTLPSCYAWGVQPHPQRKLTVQLTLADILPPDIVWHETREAASPDPLWPEEEALMVKAVPRRRQEFALSRTCARRALTHLGLPPAPLVTRPDRAPDWPSRVTGSITHCEGYTAAAVAWTRNYRSLGIDAEINQPLPPDVRPMIASAAEFAAIDTLPDAGIHWDRLLFSAKESIFKTWSPLTGVWLDFLDADLRIDPETATFHAAIAVSHPAGFASVQGRYARIGAYLVTAICLPA